MLWALTQSAIIWESLVNYPTGHFTTAEPRNPSYEVSELHKDRRFPDFRFLKCEMLCQELAMNKIRLIFSRLAYGR